MCGLRYAAGMRTTLTQPALAQLARALGVIMIMYKVSTSSRSVNNRLAMYSMIMVGSSPWAAQLD